jgi:hypothetical protein
MTKIEDYEQMIVGGWVSTDGGFAEDFNSKRILRLVSDVLVEISRDASGWDALYSDPRDNRLWELTYPESYKHGGGAPRLECVALDYAARKYGYSNET